MCVCVTGKKSRAEKSPLLEMADASVLISPALEKNWKKGEKKSAK